MRACDMQGSVMAGLVSRFVWIWPTWDADRTTRSLPFETQTVELGWFQTDDTRPGDGGAVDFCRCENVVVSRSGTTLRRCVYNNATSDEETLMSADRCRINTAYMSESVSADHVVNKMTASPDWIAPDDDTGVIIDIDEDFFGCESPSNQLASRLGNRHHGDQFAGDWQQVELIGSAVSLLLCPRDAQDESVADRLVRRLVGLVVDVCQRQHRRGGTRCTPPSLDSVVISAFVARPLMFCASTAARVKAAWSYLSAVLVRVPLTLLHVVLGVGFCLNTAPRTYNFRQQPNVGDLSVCYGANEPNSSLVYLHTPSHVELDVQMRSFARLVAEVLGRIESKQERRSVLVTVSRSVRDGYTPRSLASRIERGILRALGQAARNSGRMAVIYDRDLLGGRQGWNSRASSQPRQR